MKEMTIKNNFKGLIKHLRTPNGTGYMASVHLLTGKRGKPAKKNRSMVQQPKFLSSQPILSHVDQKKSRDKINMSFMSL